MTSTLTKIRGFAAYSKDEPLKPFEYTPRPLGEEDVTLKIMYCGICGSDIHTIDSGWGPTSYPCIVGHEIVGRVVEVGSQVSHLKIGDRVGVGAQSYACLKCETCKEGCDNLCPKAVGTYNSRYADGFISQGGYADYVRLSSFHAFKIPEKLASDVVAPLLCAGVTVFAPLRRFGAGPGKVVGVAGIGGLGHLAVQFASKMGAHTVAVSTTASKKSAATTLGAHSFVALSSRDDLKKARGSMDLLVVTATDPSGSVDVLLSLLKHNGVLVLVGAPETSITTMPFSLIIKQRAIVGSSIGSRKDVTDMLDFAAEKGVMPWIEVEDMEKCNDAVQRVREGTPRFRVVLKHKDSTKL
ncbi:hypothetical protein HDU76_013133 [Blyttiomyces sp. JEL0837]|nr:hypothetical protein HDU76_013133 [Blyttiomyces sp. JEL0837]